MAKNRNTFEKHRREVEKKRKAAEKKERRRKKKELPDEHVRPELASVDKNGPNE